MIKKFWLFNKNIILSQSLVRHLNGLTSSNENNIKILKTLFKKYNQPKSFEHLLEKHPNLSKLTKAAVLIPISVRETSAQKYETFYSLTQRTPNLRFYGGQICFIGGKMDATDENAVEAAKREAKEEVDIPSERLTILAQMHPLIITNIGKDSFLLYPIVAYYDDKNFAPTLNKEEVECLYELPTERFLSSENHEIAHVELTDVEYHLHYFNDVINRQEITIWSITALISIVVSTILHKRAPPFDIDPIVKLDPNNVNKFFDEFVSKSIKLLEHFHRPEH